MVGDVKIIMDVLYGVSFREILSVFWPEMWLVAAILLSAVMDSKEKYNTPDDMSFFIGIYGMIQLESLLDCYSGAHWFFVKTQKLAVWGMVITLFTFIVSRLIKNESNSKLLVWSLLLFLNLMLYSTDFMTFYICLEASSFAVFLLCLLGSKTIVKVESTVKYFVVTCFSSSFILLGMSLLYKIYGTLDFGHLGLIYFENHVGTDFYMVFPLMLVLLGLIFKIGLFPGYVWVADVSEGIGWGPFLLVNVLMKLVLLIFVKLVIFDIYNFPILPAVVGIGSYLMGTFLTLAQTKLVRFLAFGSISHLGLVFSTFGLSDFGAAGLFYLVLYFFALSRFVALIDSTILNTSRLVYLTDLSYLLDDEERDKFLYSILELGGFPPFNLFWMKLLIVGFLLKNGFFWLVVCVLLISVVGLFYYLRVLKNVIYDLNSPFVIRMRTLRSAMGFDLYGLVDSVAVGIVYWLLFVLDANIDFEDLGFMVIFVCDCVTAVLLSIMLVK